MARCLFILMVALAVSGCGGRGSEQTGAAPAPGSVAARTGEVATSAANVSVSLNPGWNAVGFQCPQLAALAPNPQVPAVAAFNGTSYDVESFGLTEVNSGAGGRRGLWVFASAATNISYSGSRDTVGGVNLTTGWNLVSLAQAGPVHGANVTATVGGQPVPLNSVVLSTFYQLNADSGYSTVRVGPGGGNLLGGKAYWVYSLGPASLQWAPPPVLPATKLRFSVQPIAGTAGQTLTPAVQVEMLDAEDQLVASSGNTIVLGVTSGPGALNGTTSQSTAEGVATFSDLSLSVAGNYTLQATMSGLTPASGQPLSISAAGADRLVFTVPPTTTVADALINPPVEVEVQDPFGNRILSASNNLTLSIAPGLSSPGGSWLNSFQETSLNGAFSQGLAVWSNLRPNKTGNYVLFASSPGFPTVNATFNVTVGAPAGLAFTQQPAASVTGFDPIPVNVTIVDSAGNPTTATSNVTLSVDWSLPTGRGTGLGPVSAVNGVASFPQVRTTRNGAGYRLIASSPGLTSATSAPFNVFPKTLPIRLSGSGTEVAGTTGNFIGESLTRNVFLDNKGRIHVCWVDAARHSVYTRRSLDYGTTFGPTILVYSDPAFIYTSTLTAGDGDEIYVGVATSSPQILVARSLDGGASFEPAVDAGADPLFDYVGTGGDGNFCMLAEGSYVYLQHHGWRFCRSSDRGATFTGFYDVGTLNNYGGLFQDPMTGKLVYVQEGGGTINYRLSSDHGNTWEFVSSNIGPFHYEDITVDLGGRLSAWSSADLGGSEQLPQLVPNLGVNAFGPVPAVPVARIQQRSLCADAGIPGGRVLSAYKGFSSGDIHLLVKEPTASSSSPIFVSNGDSWPDCHSNLLASGAVILISDPSGKLFLYTWGD